MEGDVAAKINAAVQECLRLCVQHRVASAEVPAFIMGLKDDPTWNAAEIDVAKQLIFRALATQRAVAP